MINTTKIKINKTNYVLKSHSYRSMFLFEDITGHKVNELVTLKDQVTYIYCILKTANDNFDYSLEQFFDLLDEQPNIIEEFAKLNTTVKKNNRTKR